MTSGATAWLTGLPSAGKSTVARQTAQLLSSWGNRVEVIDGDQVRKIMNDQRFDRNSRDANIQRIGWISRLLARNGVIVLVAAIAPFSDSRDAVRGQHAAEGVPFLEVHVDAPVECCAQRDVKGLYAKHRRGLLTGLTGVDDPYEAPTEPDLRLFTDREDATASANRLAAYLVWRGIARTGAISDQSMDSARAPQAGVVAAALDLGGSR